MENTTKDQTPREANPEMALRFPLTITQELYDAWQRLRRLNDPKRIAEKLKISRRLIDVALNYGHIKNADNVKRINKFFEDRLTSEKKGEEKLTSQP